MGEAKRRGTFEERKAAAIEHDMRSQSFRAEIERRNPSPKHTRLMAAVVGLIAGMNANRYNVGNKHEHT